MSYLGKTQLKSSDIQRFDVTSSTSATHILSWTAPNEQSLIITINGVKQQDDAYSISGSPTTVTLTDALVATDKLEIIGIVDVGTMNVPGVGSVQTDQLADDAVTADKLANSINTEIAANTAKVTNATHTGDVTGATALTIANDAVTAAKMADSAFLANRNYIINGDFDVWQRGTSFTISSAGPGEYTADRWKFEGNNFSGSLTRQSFATNQTDVPNCPAYYARWINTTTMPAGQKVQFLQPIELKPNGFKLANQEVTFSCWLKSVSGTIPDGNIKLIKESAVYPSVGAIGTTWTKFTHTWTVWNSNQGYMWIGFECPATYSLTNGLDIAHCQLEIGDTATPFENKTYGQELFACQRYWQRVKENWWAYATSTSVIDSFVQFIPDMRAAPSVTLDDNTPTFQKVNVANVTGSSSSITASSLNTTRGFVRIDGFSGLTSNSDYLLVSTPFYFDAEL